MVEINKEAILDELTGKCAVMCFCFRVCLCFVYVSSPKSQSFIGFVFSNSVAIDFALFRSTTILTISQLVTKSNLWSFTEFGKKKCADKIPEILDAYLESIAASGDPMYVNKE